MSNNRYAPPVAAVGDIAEERPPRPLQVTWAVRLLWATTICSLPQLYASAVHAPSTAGLIVTLAFEGLMIASIFFIFSFSFQKLNNSPSRPFNRKKSFVVQA